MQWKSGSQSYNDSDRQEVVTSGLSHTITGLGNSTSYTVQVTAVNDVGPGSPSGQVNVKAGPLPAISGVNVDDATITKTAATATVTIANTDGATPNTV